MGASTATLPVRPVTNEDAWRDTTNSSSLAACSTRWRASGETVDMPRRVRETVETDTPARSATSAIVGYRWSDIGMPGT